MNREPKPRVSCRLDNMVNHADSNTGDIRINREESVSQPRQWLGVEGETKS